MNAEQNNTVSLPQLIQLLADISGIDAAESRKFLHEFFALVEEILVQGQSVKIKGIGSFAVEDPENGLVRFTPDPELAAAVNTPFAMFEPMELGDDILPEDLAEEGEEEQQPEDTDVTEKEEYVLAIDAPEEPAEEAENEIENTVPDEPAEEQEAEEVEPAEETYTQSTDDSADDPTADTTEEYKPSAYDTYVETEEQSERRGIKGYVATAIVAITVGFLIGFYTHKSVYGYNKTEAVAVQADSIGTANTERADSLTVPESTVETTRVTDAIVPAEPVKAVKDTIRTNHFLASMARRHYGHMEYWVYIYEANAGLGHPDRIKPGTVVTIPPSSEFTQGSDSATMAYARRLYAEIYSRYK